MARPKVTVYIETSIRGPAIRTGRYIYLLETQQAGRPVTRIGSGTGTDNETGLALTAAGEALGRLNKSCDVTLVTANGNLRDAVSQGWISEWQQSDWKNKKGKPLSHREQWEALGEKMEPHSVTAETGLNHKYRGLMLRQLELQEQSDTKNITK